MKLIFNQLKKYVYFINGALYFGIVLEVILVALISIGASNIDKDYWKVTLVISIIFYIFIFIFKSIYQIKFPNKIVDELESKYKLAETDKLLERQKDLNRFICMSIQKLNEHTCSIIQLEEDEENDTDICKEGLTEGLSKLIQPIVQNTDVLLNSKIEKNFSVGVFLENVVGYDDKDIFGIAAPYILRDDLSLKEFIDEGLYPNENHLKGLSFEINTAINRAINNNSYSVNPLEASGNCYNIICSPIPIICSDDDNDGVLFIILKKEINIPDDLKDILQIFNRVIVNYINKYNSCQNAKYNYIKKFEEKITGKNTPPVPDSPE